MAQASLRDMAREVVLYSSGVCPYMLAERWIRDRYRKCNERHIWSYKLARSSFGTPDQYSTGSITMTNGSQIVSGSGTTFTNAMVGRQLKVGGFGGFVFTITGFTNATTITVDDIWQKATAAAQPYSIVQCYITPSPSNFHAFYSVLDPDNGWLLRLGFNSKELDRIDSRRAATGVPRIIANNVYNSNDVATYELWPHPNTQKQYPYTYEKRIPDLVNAVDTPPPILRSDLLVKGALADLARWPGTIELKNPLFDPYFNQWKNRELEFETDLAKLIVEDQSILLTDLTYGHQLNMAPLDAKFMQQHAFPAY